MIIRQNDKLGSLPAEDRAKLDQWLQTHPYRTVLRLLAAPRPEGLNLKTNLGALSRYFNRFLKPDPCAELADLAAQNPAAAEEAASTLIQSQAILAAATQVYHSKFNVRDFNALLRFQFRMKSSRQRQEYLDYRQYALAFRMAQKGEA